jgi:hypothetical protein
MHLSFWWTGCIVVYICCPSRSNKFTISTGYLLANVPQFVLSQTPDNLVTVMSILFGFAWEVFPNAELTDSYEHIICLSTLICN